MKISPPASEAYLLDGLYDAENFVDQVLKDYEQDYQDTWSWRMKAAHFYARRYGMLGRNVTQPWPDASDIVLPLIDKTIIAMIPGYQGLVFGPEVPTKQVALDEDGVKHLASAEAYMNSMLMGHHPLFSQNDWFNQFTYTTSNMLTVGHGCMWPHWSFKTEIGMREISKDDLPSPLRFLTIGPDLTDDEVRAMQEQAKANGQDLNPPDVLRFFDGVPANPLNKASFETYAQRITDIIVRGMGFDEDDKADRAAVGQIIRWMRAGYKNKTVAIHTRFEVENTARIDSIPPEDIIVPRGVMGIQSAPRVAIRKFYHEHEILQMAHDERWVSGAVDEMLDTKDRGDGDQLDTDGMIRATRRARANQGEDVVVPDEDMYEVLRIYLWHDLVHKDPSPSDKLLERMELIVNPATRARLLTRRLPNRHRSWPVVDLRFEVDEPTYASSRGIGEMIDDPDKHLTAWHRAKENSMLIQTSTGFFIRRQSVQSPEPMRFRPGMIEQLDNPQGDVVPISMPQTSVVIEREEQFLQVWVQGYLGELANDMTADARLLEPRTKGEVEIREAARQRVMRSRARGTNAALSEVYRMFWSDAMQWAPKQFYADLTGEDPRPLKPDNILGMFSTVPIGAVDDMDPVFRRQQAVNRWQLTEQIFARYPADPKFFVNPIEAAKAALNEYGVMESRILMPRRSENVRKQMEAQLTQEAQEAMVLAEIKKLLDANIPVSPEMLQKLLDGVREILPHKGMQRIAESGEQASELFAQLQAMAQEELGVGQS
jgi:hypothetical protein